MVDQLPVLAESVPTPELGVSSPSLTVAVPTGMLLVDYALAGKATPTPEPQSVARALPDDLIEASHPVRAALAHGSALRSVVMAQLPDGHPGHTDWPALRQWLADFDDGRMLGLIEYGVGSVLAYGAPPGERRTVPEDEVAGLLGSTDTLRHDGVEVLEAWGVSDPNERSAELTDPAAFRGILLDLLDATWEHWLASTWTDGLPALRAAIDAAPAPAPGGAGVDWVTLVTGLRPSPQYAEALDRARRVVVTPCPGLGRSLSIVRWAGDRLWVAYSPAAKASEPSTAVAVTDLAPLAPTMHALGDRTRLAIVLHLLDQGPQSMQQLTDALRVHQSTVSRQVSALRKAGLLTVEKDRRVAVRKDPIRSACQTLLTALE